MFSLPTLVWLGLPVVTPKVVLTFSFLSLSTNGVTSALSVVPPRLDVSCGKVETVSLLFIAVFS